MEQAVNEESGLRRGAAGVPFLIAVGITLALGAGVVFGRASMGQDGNIFGQTASLVSQTLGDIFYPEKEVPDFEIDLREEASAGQDVLETSLAGDSSGSKGAETSSKDPAAGRVTGNVLQPAAARATLSDASATTDIAVASSSPSAGAARAVAPAPQNIPVACDFAAGGTPNHAVLINEIAWMGTQTSASDEWMELKNNSGEDLALAGWQLMDADGDIKISFDETGLFPRGGLYLLERTDDGSVPNVPADKIYSGSLSNSGAWLKLFDNHCAFIDEIAAADGWPAGDRAARLTLERDVRSFGWHSSAIAGGTPKSPNDDRIPAVAFVPPPAPVPASAPPPQEPPPASSGRALISEIMAGSDAGASYEFVELYNPGSGPLDLTGWSVKKKSFTGAESSLVVASRFEGKVIPAQHYFLLANEGGYTGAVLPDVVWPSSYSLAYTNNAVLLYDAQGAVVEEVNWAEIPRNQSYTRGSWSESQFSLTANPTPENASGN
ncbi:MAG: hypothetical protein UY96_C0004G0010 [Parcubacteria group bacterium GW2011_GWB1_56_8]|nr:MAG: hypothetical protein UY96_C0004G0010 [Parcubacteria group bacterium GW2011_GWB1_56_8]